MLDLSWNSLGISRECAESISDFISDRSKKLIHLDLAFNKFMFEESTIISQSLKGNKTIFGFHFEGKYINIYLFF